MLLEMTVCALFINAAAAGLFYYELYYNREKDTLGEKGLSWQGNRPPISAILYGCIMLATAVGLSLFISGFYLQNTFLFTAKRAVMLALLWPIAYIDFRTGRIPNTFIVSGLAARMLILIAEFLLERETFLSVLVTEAAASAILFLTALVCTLIVKNSIGGGDMKLFIVMGLLLGLQGTWGAIFLSLIVSFVIAVFLLLTKKKTRRDAIPFGPALAVGTYLSIFLTGM